MQAGGDALWTATGFGAWGMTGGTLAGMILSDLVRGVPNPWAEIYDAPRIAPATGAGRFLRENMGGATEWIGGRLTPGAKRYTEGLRARGGAGVSGADGQGPAR